MDEAAEGRRLIIISGLSGAGKSLVIDALEDQGFFCIDNLPVSLLEQLSSTLADPDSGFPSRVGIGIDARSGEHDLSALPTSIARLRDRGVRTEILFLEADKNILTSRFSETRRKHPLSSRRISLSDALDRERVILDPLNAMADLRIDTSHTTVHELRTIIRDRLAQKSAGSLSMQFVSFGYKHGIPHDADYVFDVRCLPNPHWDKKLRPHTGKDPEVINFLRAQPAVMAMLEDIQSYLDHWIPHFEAENRSYLCIAIGCTGGHHRSVYLVEELSRHFEQQGKDVVLRHRDL